MAEAILNQKARGRLVAESAGPHPAVRVNPYTIEALREVGIDWRGRQRRSIDDLESPSCDIVITLCDRAREACPTFPRQPALAHWGMEDPAAVEGDEEAKRCAFRETLQLISRRIEDAGAADGKTGKVGTAGAAESGLRTGVRRCPAHVEPGFHPRHGRALEFWQKL
jgi:protein-tyrosine-phosphatase